MIVGTGIDVIEISRIKRTVERFSDRFITRIFSRAEREYCMAKRLPEVHLAARFAAKEAASKALGTGLSGGVLWRDIEVGVEPSGKPYLVFHNAAAMKLADIGGSRVHISLSDTDGLAVASVIIESGM
ncbi:MAG: holo-ACP synthase [Candidatus Hydrogenedentes bacterium]|nr:holo-ACP synthase [Candidatus Hydrogenedentota bacterium]